MNSYKPGTTEDHSKAVREERDLAFMTVGDGAGRRKGVNPRHGEQELSVWVCVTNNPG